MARSLNTAGFHHRVLGGNVKYYTEDNTLTVERLEQILTEISEVRGFTTEEITHLADLARRSDETQYWSQDRINLDTMSGEDLLTDSGEYVHTYWDRDWLKRNGYRCAPYTRLQTRVKWPV